MRSSLVMREAVLPGGAGRSQLVCRSACETHRDEDIFKRLLGLGALAAMRLRDVARLRATQGRHRRQLGSATVPVPAAAAHRSSDARPRPSRHRRRRSPEAGESGVGRAERRRVSRVAPGEGEARERDLPRARRRELRRAPSRTAATPLADAAEPTACAPPSASSNSVSGVRAGAWRRLAAPHDTCGADARASRARSPGRRRCRAGRAAARRPPPVRRSTSRAPSAPRRLWARCRRRARRC